MTCNRCGGDLRSDNASGFCNEQERRAARLREAYADGRRYNTRARKRGGKYKCLGCGKIILPNLGNQSCMYTCKGCCNLAGELRALMAALEKNEQARAVSGG